MRTVGEGMAAAPAEPYVTLRHIRLDATQVEEVTGALDRLAAELTEAPDTEPRYGLVLGLYQHRAS